MKFTDKISIFIFVGALALLSVLGVIYYLSAGRDANAFVTINGKAIRAEVVKKPQDLYRGLSYRDGICPDCGMLFIFPSKEVETFVMRDMRFPLDIIFIADSHIVKIYQNLPPEGHIPSVFYSSGQKVDHVLEVNGGFTDKNGIKEGDKVKIQ